MLPFITNFGKRALARATGITATLSIQLLSAWQGWPKSLTRDRIANKSVRRRARSGAVVVESRGYEYKIGRGSEFENKDPVYCTAAMYQGRVADTPRRRLAFWRCPLDARAYVTSPVINCSLGVGNLST